MRRRTCEFEIYQSVEQAIELPLILTIQRSVLKAIPLQCCKLPAYFSLD